MKSQRVSLRDVAEACGYSVASVSMALRGMGRVPARTRRRIEQVAIRLGYVRDSEMARALSRARRPAPKEGKETLVFLSELPVNQKSRAIAPWLHGMYWTARKAAHLLGYELELAVVEATVSSQRQLSRILTARGIRGLIVAPITLWNPACLELDWARFAAVSIGSTLQYPLLHVVERDYYEDLLELYGWLRECGYRRVGLALSPVRSKFLDYMPESTLLLFQQWHPEMKPVEPMASSQEWNSQELSRWLRCEKPDVVLVYEPDVPDWLRRLKVRVPRDLGVVYLTSNGGDESGLVPDVDLMVGGAMNQLARMVEAGEWGLPRRCSSHAFRHLFNTGKTIRKKRQSK